jgi:hypothetical protein
MDGVMNIFAIEAKIEQLNLFHINKGQEIKIQQVQLRAKR